MRRFHVLLFLLTLSGSAFPVLAQDNGPPSGDGAAEGEQAAEDTTIVVTAPRIQGSVETDLPLDLVLDENAIESYGASNLTDLLAALGTQTQTTRGRGQGGGAPVVLVNGRRVSGFGEVRDVPPEALKRVEVLPEDVALRFGFSADQRVVNFILKDDFAALNGELEYGRGSGRRDSSEVSASYLTIGKKGRVNLTAEWDRDTALEERDRDLLPTGGDISGLRTLLPKRDDVQLNAVVTHPLSAKVNASLNARYDWVETRGVLGLPQALINNSGATPFRVLERDGSNRAFRLGTTIDGMLGRWRWTLTGNYDRTESATVTDRNTAIVAGLAMLATDQARSRFQNWGAVATADGKLLRLPAGNVILGLRAGYNDRSFRSEAVNATGNVTGRVQRREVQGRGNVEIPLTRRSEGLGRVIGQFSANANISRSDLSDFGNLTSHGFGFVWSPFEGISVFGNSTTAQAAPSPQQLGDPTIVTPNVAVFDYLQGTTVLATLISGGNPLLRDEEQRDKSITLSVTPQKVKQLTLTATYTQKRSDAPISGFPALNAGTEGAFAGRIVRDGAGRLVSIDQRPVNFQSSRDDLFRWGFTFSRQFAQSAQTPGAGFSGGPGRGPMGYGGPRGPGTGGPGGGPGGGRGPGPGGPGIFGGGGGGRWSISLFHTVRLNDEIGIAPLVPVLDRLNGDATGAFGGTSRHSVDLDGGWFHKGFGILAIAKWKSGTIVDGGPLGTDLRFSSLATLNIRAFLNFGQKKKLIKDVPFLKGARMSLRIDNLTKSIQEVRDQNSLIPLRYQPGYVDPAGRTVVLSFRKLL